MPGGGAGKKKRTKKWWGEEGQKKLEGTRPNEIKDLAVVSVDMGKKTALTGFTINTKKGCATKDALFSLNPFHN